MNGGGEFTCFLLIAILDEKVWGLDSVKVSMNSRRNKGVNNVDSKFG